MATGRQCRERPSSWVLLCSSVIEGTARIQGLAAFAYQKPDTQTLRWAELEELNNQAMCSESGKMSH